MERWESCVNPVYQIPGSGPSRVVLLVDDHEEDRIFFERAALASLSRIMLVHATGAPEVFPFLDRCLATDTLPDLIVLDIKLPKVSGFDILQAIRGEPRMRDLKVVILTGSPVEADRERARELGVDGYFIKPGDPADYTAIIERVFGINRQLAGRER